MDEFALKLAEGMRRGFDKTGTQVDPVTQRPLQETALFDVRIGPNVAQVAIRTRRSHGFVARKDRESKTCTRCGLPRESVIHT